ncbi:transposase [Chloroflexi bacterium TSY]|nr:transposase [Chloroflexi bacterium TSY]
MYNRGAGKQSIFYEDENYRYLLRLMKAVAKECQISFIAYCLLPNHYHWFVRQKSVIEAGVLPKRVFGSYVQSFNRRYDRRGTLFEGRVEIKLVDEDRYVRHLCRYIHANPVKHGIALAPDLWPYSNYLEWIAKRNGTLVDRNFIDQWGVVHFRRTIRFTFLQREKMFIFSNLSHAQAENDLI